MRPLLTILLMLLMTSCQQSVSDKLCSQGWKLDGFDIGTALENELAGAENKDIREMLRKHLEKSLAKTEMSWRFYPKGIFAMLVDGRYSPGSWEFNETSGLLTLKTEEIRQVFRVESRDKEMIFWQLGRKGNDTGEVAVTLQPSDEYQNEGIDLLAPSRNTWRVKPNHPEMFQDIKMRLVNQLTYMIDYFELVEKKEQGYFSTTHLNAPFRFYSGGMGLLNFNQLPSDWMGQFHGNGDALVAHVLLNRAFDSNITFPSSKKSYSDAYAKFLKQVKIFVLTQEEPESLPVY